MAVTTETAASRLDSAGPEPAVMISNNKDLRPTTDAQRTSTAWEFVSLWISLVVGVPSYYIAGSLVEQGMSWWQGIAVVISANLILLFPLILTSQPGTRYGIPFPVLARSAFGVRGAHVPSLLRALVACGWFGIETWIGGQAFFFLLLPSSLRVGSSSYSRPVPWLGTSILELACFIVFWLAQLVILWRGMGAIRKLGRYSAPVLVLLTSSLFGWAYLKAGGFGKMLSLPSRLTPSQFWNLFFPSLTANVGSWATMAISIPDFSRYARSQADQILGQMGLPLFMGSFAFVGLAVTSSTEVIFGRVISNPIQLLGEIEIVGGVFTWLVIAIPGISLAIVTTNVPANVVAPANALVSLSPSTFSFRGGALLTALIGGFVFQPWRIFQSSQSFVYTWLVGYSAVMGPISGILLTDYYILRRMVLDVDALYSADPGGPYYYYGGYNVAAMAALVISVAPIVPGFLHRVGMVEAITEAFAFIYNVSWFFGFFVSGIVYWALSPRLRGILLFLRRQYDCFFFPISLFQKPTPDQSLSGVTEPYLYLYITLLPAGILIQDDIILLPAGIGFRLKELGALGRQLDK